VKYERVQAQAWFETHLRDEGLEPVPHTPDASKEDRIIGLSVPFDNGHVKLLDWSDVRGKDMDWSAFRTEWAGFPSGKVDQLDAVAQALDDVTFGRRAEGSGLDLYGRDRLGSVAPAGHGVREPAVVVGVVAHGVITSPQLSHRVLSKSPRNSGMPWYCGTRTSNSDWQS